jgi:diaminopimelate decarboxylase
VAKVYDEMGGATASRIGIRVNPLVGAGDIAALSVSTANSKFGISDLEAVKDSFAAHPWLSMLHVHVGSQGCSLDMLASGAGLIANLADEINGAAGREQVSVLDIGGGLPADYNSCDDSPSFEEYAEVLRVHAPQLFDPARAPGSVITEFGRALSAKSASLVSAVEYTMHRESPTQLAIIHAGSDLFVRPCYAPASFYHRVSAYGPRGSALLADMTAFADHKDVFDPAGERELATHDIAGPMCFAGDVVARGVQLPQLDVGDWVLVHDCGANTMGLFSRHCSRPTPPVFGYTQTSGDDYDITMLKRPESDESVLAFWD